MTQTGCLFNEQATLRKLALYLPHQLPLKDFVHHNTLSAFQEFRFEEALCRASKIFGYKTSLNLDEYREMYGNHKIRESILEEVLVRNVGEQEADDWVHKLLNKKYDQNIGSRLGDFRQQWKDVYNVDLEHGVNNLLFRLVGSYLDQGVGRLPMPISPDGFLATVRDISQSSMLSVTRSKLGKTLLARKDVQIEELLDFLVADPCLYERYLFEQQFGHPGWSGMVATLESHPESLVELRQITLKDFIKLELILEIDALESRLKGRWKPFKHVAGEVIGDLFAPTEPTELDRVKCLWQEAFEWSYYDAVLAAVQKAKQSAPTSGQASFQAFFCIDDREGSFRRHIEALDKNCSTYGTPGHFGIIAQFRPAECSNTINISPGSKTGKHTIVGTGRADHLKQNIHFSPRTNAPLTSYFISLFAGFWSALLLFYNIFRPRKSALAISSFAHATAHSGLKIAADESSQNHPEERGYSTEEMSEVVEGVLRTAGLVSGFADLIYIISHGASSVNNTHYAGYDCGACAGRPGSVNARSFCTMANDPKVRSVLSEKGISVPSKTVFFPGLHDTTRDEIEFYHDQQLSASQATLHQLNQSVFTQALENNARERARRLFEVNPGASPSKVHEKMKRRSVSLFEPRPELNHANNALCLVGRRNIYQGLFLDRRSFLQSYDHTQDATGELLTELLSAIVPVCAGINLEYYFSRVDNQKLGAGSKLPHNVAGLIGVTNGVEGDLRTGLPQQMIELHDPIRLMMVVEQAPEVVLKAIMVNESLYNWFDKSWVHLSCIDPSTGSVYRFYKGGFSPYTPSKKLIDIIEDADSLLERSASQMPVYLIRKS
ncbi:MAG: DUF2309 domain-containing protein [Flavobacteriales bacterium]|nr:DUF2309 domain-containing protein [Flavobacteriales bacterium]